jgi:hypothetical protein
MVLRMNFVVRGNALRRKIVLACSAKEKSI